MAILGIAKCNAMQYNAMQCISMHFNASECIAMHCDAMQWVWYTYMAAILKNIQYGRHQKSISKGTPSKTDQHDII